MNVWRTGHAGESGMKPEPQFLLSAGYEMRGDLATLRACRPIGRLRDSIRDDHMLIEVDPPVIGQAYGLGGRDITELVLSARWVGSTLFPVTEWPCHVYISRILDESVVRTSTFTGEQVEMIGWGAIFRTLDEATG